MLKPVTIFHEPHEINAALEEKRIPLSVLEDAGRANFLARASCTSNDAPTAAGSKGYFDTVRTIADGLAPLGFYRKNEQNSPYVVSPDDDFYLMVATGDEATGNRHINPKTKSDKGSITANAVDRNKSQLRLFSENDAPQVISINRHRGDRLKTKTGKPLWVYLVYAYVDQASENPRHILRHELSMPEGMDQTGRIAVWNTRIVLPEIDLDPSKMFASKPGFTPDTDLIITSKQF